MQKTATPSRKRPAPGTSPIVPTYMPTGAESTDFVPAFDYSNPQYANDSAFADPSGFDANSFAAALNGQQGTTFGNPNSTVPSAQPSSTDLVRRARNQGGQEQWNSFSGYAAVNGTAEDEDERDLDAKVALAKKDAQGKRKQIPPFVQKLSSFLDDQNNNQGLIRWSDDGRSFIVVDEDEFARTLIPELFKHNNYASFVRQLNMYGFHKTVNITDGSLRQSEKARKGVKPPSMYSHPYFRRNRPDLLWLIQKPSTKSNKRKRDGDKGDSDDERQFSPGPEGKPQVELGTPGAPGELANLPKSDLAAVRQEIQTLQNQQRMISRMISQLKEQNDQFYRQATAFQQLHDRHENSINAILTFLATFYNRSLDGHAGQNLVNMFTNANQHNNQQHGSVVEDFTDTPTNSGAQISRPPKKQPLLLTAPPNTSNVQGLQPGSAITEPPSARSSKSPTTVPDPQIKRSRSDPSEDLRATPGARVSKVTASPQVKQEAPTPEGLHQVPESDQMMSLINSVNATNASTPATTAPTLDFSSALEHYQNANGNAPLTPQQRDDMLALMSNQQGGDAGDNNALVSKAPSMPNLEQLKQSQHQLNVLENMQKQQDAKLQRLSSQLQPLSPTGQIAGLSGEGSDYGFDSTGGPGDFDPSAFLNFDNFDPNAGFGDDINFNFDDNTTNNGGNIEWDFGNDSGAGNPDDMFNEDASHLAPPRKGSDDTSAHGRVESVSTASSAPSPAGIVENDEPGTPSRKRARQ